MVISVVLRYLSEERFMKTYLFKVVVEPDENVWTAYCPTLLTQGASTWGKTQREALKHIHEVVEMIVGELIEDGEAVPPKTLRRIIEDQARWTRADLRRLGLIR